jgi:hypothetical protein
MAFNLETSNLGLRFGNMVISISLKSGNLRIIFCPGSKKGNKRIQIIGFSRIFFWQVSMLSISDIIISSNIK